MLNESEYLRAVGYIKEYRQLKREPDYNNRRKEIEAIIQKEFGYLIKDPDIKMTPLKLEHMVKDYEQQQEQKIEPQPQSQSDTNRFEEITKQPPSRIQEARYGTNRYITPAEPKNPEPDRPPPEPEPEQRTEQTFTVTHPEQKPKGIPERYLKAMEQKKHHEREHRHDRYRDFEKGKDR